MPGPCSSPFEKVIISIKREDVGIECHPDYGGSIKTTLSAYIIEVSDMTSPVVLRTDAQDLTAHILIGAVLYVDSL